MAEDHQLLPGLLRLSCGDGWREGEEGGKEGRFLYNLHCPCFFFFFFFTKYYLNFLLVYNLCRKRGILKPVI